VRLTSIRYGRRRRRLGGWSGGEIGNSVHDRLWMDLRFLLWLPAMPFIVVLYFIQKPSVLAYVLGVGMLTVTIPWVLLLFRRRAVKKRSWQKATRFSDMNDGY
jgi:hypothetical protein